MKLVKLALISFVFFFLLLTGISLLMPSVTHISKAIDINAPADSVYHYINNTANWQYWYADYDSSASFSPKVAGDGTVLVSNKTTVAITESLPRKIKATWQTGKGNPLDGEFNFITKDSAAYVTVQWIFTQKVKWYPWQKFASIASAKVVGPFMEKSLENLKKKSEKK